MSEDRPPYVAAPGSPPWLYAWYRDRDAARLALRTQQGAEALALVTRHRRERQAFRAAWAHPPRVAPDAPDPRLGPGC